MHLASHLRPARLSTLAGTPTYHLDGRPTFGVNPTYTQRPSSRTHRNSFSDRPTPTLRLATDEVWGVPVNPDDADRQTCVACDASDSIEVSRAEVLLA